RRLLRVGRAGRRASPVVVEFKLRKVSLLFFSSGLRQMTETIRHPPRIQLAWKVQALAGFRYGRATLQWRWSIQRTKERTDRTLVLMSQGSCKRRENDACSVQARGLSDNVPEPF